MTTDRNNEAETKEEYNDELLTAKPGEILIFDEAGTLDRRTRDRFKQKFELLTPEAMDRRIDNLRDNPLVHHPNRLDFE